MGTNDMAAFGHRDRASSTEYALAHAASGKTNINTAPGENLDFRIGAALKASLGATGLILYNINSEATDVDKFLVTNAGLIKYRTGAQLLSDASGGTLVVGDHGAAATDEVINVCYGDGAPPDAETTTEGAIFIKYIA